VAASHPCYEQLYLHRTPSVEVSLKQFAEAPGGARLDEDDRSKSRPLVSSISGPHRFGGPIACPVGPG